MIVFRMDVNVYESQQLQPSNVASSYSYFREMDLGTLIARTRHGVSSPAKFPPSQVGSDVTAARNGIITA